MAHRIQVILESDRAEELVRGLDPVTFHNMVQELGLAESRSLIELATPEQRQVSVDLDCWVRDELDLGQLEAWLEPLFSLSDKGIDEIVRRFDIELLGLYLKSNLQIYLYRDEEDADILDNIDASYESSPDGVYALVMPEDEHTSAVIRLGLRRLYASDQDYARQLLRDARHEHKVELAEEAYRIRCGRLEQFGFLPPEEAAEIYSFLDPGKQRRLTLESLEGEEITPIVDLETGDRVEFPHLLTIELLQATGSSPTFFGAAFRERCDQVDDPSRVDLYLRELRALIHRVIMASCVDPGDMNVQVEAGHRVQEHIEVGLSYLADQDHERAVAILARTPLKLIFKVAFNLVRSLATQAKRLVERSHLSLVEELPTSLCQASEIDLVGGLISHHPFRSLIHQTGFETLEQLETAAATLATLAYKELWAFHLRGLSIDELKADLLGPPAVHVPIDSVTFDSLLTTSAAVQLLDGEAGLRGLTPKELRTFIKAHISNEAISDLLADTLEEVACPAETGLDPSSTKLAKSWVIDTTSRLIAEYGALELVEKFDYRFLPPLLLITADQESDV